MAFIYEKRDSVQKFLTENEVYVLLKDGREKYKIIRKLKVDKYSAVFEAMKDNERFTLKISEKDLIEEWKIMEEFGENDRFLIKGKTYAIVGNFYVIVMDYFDGVFLSDLQLPLDSNKIRIIVVQIFVGVFFLHGRKIIWADVSFENVLVNPKTLEVMLIGFNSDKRKGSVTLEIVDQGIKCINALSPPELEKGLYEKTVDIFYVGLMAYVLGEGCREINKTNLEYKKIKDIRLIDFINKTTALCACDRVGFNKTDYACIRKIPFFKGVKWRQLMKRGFSRDFIPPYSELIGVTY